MKRRTAIHLVSLTSLALGLCFVDATAEAQGSAPAQVPMQGYLTDMDDAPIDGSVTLTIGLYDSDVAPTALYSESQSVLVDRGSFTVYVGEGDTGGGDPLDLVMFNDYSNLWVGIAIDGGTEMPRFQLATTPFAGFAQYANVATNATSLGGNPAADYALTTDTQRPISGSCPAGQAIRSIASDGTVTCESSGTYAAGTGLTLSSGTFSVDTAAIQRRVASSCSGGQAIAAIGADGSVTCVADADTDTTYSAGTGLTLSSTTFSVDSAVVQSRVTGTCGTTGEFITGISSGGTVTCQNVFGTTNAAVHYGNAGRTGQASLWGPATLPGAASNSTANGVWIEGGTGESGGFFANGDTAAIWSPGDTTVELDDTANTRISGTLLAIHDEDGISGTPDTSRPEFVFSSFDTRRFAVSNGAYLSSGGVWTNTSDRKVKFAVTTVDRQAVLERLASVEVSEWSYLVEGEGVRHMGPMAQDFYAAFELGYDERSIPTVDADGVALVAIQALHERNAALVDENARLSREVEELDERLRRLEALFADAR